MAPLKRRGQVWSLDFTAGIVIMLLLLTVIGPYYNSVKSGIREDQGTILRQAIRTSEILMTPGVPYDWNENEDNVSIVGLADPDNPSMLVPEKIVSFINMTTNDYANYTSMKKMLRCDAAYEFQVNGTYDNGSLVFINGTNFSVGIAPASDAGNVISITRYARIGMNMVQVKLLLWDKVEDT